MKTPMSDDYEDDEPKTGKKCKRCGRFKKDGSYCCDSEFPEDGPEVDDDPDYVDVPTVPSKKKKSPPRIGSLADDIFGK